VSMARDHRCAAFGALVPLRLPKLIRPMPAYVGGFASRLAVAVVAWMLRRQFV
jgi:hypothetical protein